MSGDQDLIQLYSGRILALAAEIPLTERLPNPDATVRHRAPLCGSTVTVDVIVKDGRISGFGQEVRACALGQAAASVVGSAIVGRNEAEVRRAHDELVAMLQASGPAPAAPFDGLAVLEPARDYRNRHASILLALNAILEALEQIREPQKL